VNAGAVTWGSGTTGVTGVVSATNSLVGTSASSQLTYVGSQDGRIIVQESIGLNRPVYVGFTDPSQLTFASATGQDITMTPGFLTRTLDTGTAVTLQASNDITVNSPIVANNPGGAGGALTLQAGRSILLNAGITTDDGNLTLIGNERLVAGLVDADRAAGDAVIAMAAGTTLNAGAGDVVVDLRDGQGKTNAGAGLVTLANVQARDVTVTNALGGVTVAGAVQAARAVSMVGAGQTTIAAGGSVANADATRDVVLASTGGAFVNQAGAGAVSAARRLLVYAADPATSARGGLAGRNFYGLTYAGNGPGTIGGADNRFLFASVPTLTVTAADASKVYGDALPAFTFTTSGLVDGDLLADALAGSPLLTTAASQGSGVGGYAIAAEAGTATSPAGYTLAFAPGTLTVTPAALTVAAEARSKVYGDADPALTFQTTGLRLSDTAGSVLTGALTRAAGENVGAYGIGQGTLASNANYTIAFTGANLTVTPAPLTIAAEARSKVYGDADPALTFQTAGLRLSDTAGSVLTGALTRAAGENVGAYAIGQGTLASNANYTVSFTGANLTVTPAPLTITAEARSKVYGDADPALTFQTAGLRLSDTAGSVLTGALTRAAGENVGAYAIGQGTLASNANYAIAFTGSNLTVTPAPLTVTADARSKVYGDADPALSFQAAGFRLGDTTGTALTGALTRAAGENVGAYAIGQGSLAAANYAIAFTGSNLTVTPAALTVTADARSKVYGDEDPALTFQTTGLRLSDTAGSVLTGALTRAAGENVGAYAIGQGTLASNANYTVSFTGSNLTVTPATLTVAADARSKVYGDADPTLTFQAAGFRFADTAGMVLNGALTRAAGENVGAYAIGQGTLASSANYTVSFTGANLTVTPAPLTIAGQDAAKVYGDADPAFGFLATGFRLGDTAAVLTGALGRVAGEDVGSYALQRGTLAAANYDLTVTGGALAITPAPLSAAPAAQTKTYGAADPALAVVATGLRRGDTAAQVFSGALARAAGEDAGAYAVARGTLAANANYVLTFSDGTFRIAPAPLSVRADDASRLVGEENPAFTATFSGLVRGETPAALGGALAFRTAADRSSPAGAYAVTPFGLLSANYEIAFVDGTLTVRPRAQAPAAPSRPVVPPELNRPPVIVLPAVAQGPGEAGAPAGVPFAASLPPASPPVPPPALLAGGAPGSGVGPGLRIVAGATGFPGGEEQQTQ